MVETVPRGSLPRKLTLAVASLLVGLVAAELGVRAWLLAAGRPYSAARAREALRETLVEVTGLVPGIDPQAGGPNPAQEAVDATGDDERRPREPLYVLHPYTGYVPSTMPRFEERVVRYFEQERDVDRYTIFVHGGSVAAILCGMQMGGVEALEDRIAADAASGGRKVKTYRLAVPGFKQPQQFVQLAYLLSRGCAPDLVVNLDGLNEVRLGYSNGARGVRPTWPSLDHWASVATAAGGVDPEGLDRLIVTRALQERARSVAEAALDRGYTRSAILGELTRSRLARIRAAWARAQVDYVDHRMERARAGRSSFAFGAPAGPEGALEETIECWVESSLAMHQLCAARGIRYVHVLQPTLHDEGSKPVTAEEQRAGIGERGIDARVAEGYPQLRAGIAQLRERGVEAYDLSYAFAEVEETLYWDDCHFNRPGNLILADRIADEMGLAPTAEDRER